MSRSSKEKIIEYLKKTYDPQAVILYGDYAEGTQTRYSPFQALLICEAPPGMYDDSTVDGVLLDIALYDPNSIEKEDPEALLAVCDGIVVLDQNGAAAKLCERVLEYVDAYVQPDPEQLSRELERYKRAYRKICTETGRTCYYDWHRILTDSLKFYSDLKGWGCLPVEERMERLNREDVTAAEIYHTALYRLDAVHLGHWIEYLELLCASRKNGEDENAESEEKAGKIRSTRADQVFKVYWMKVQGLLTELSYERYIDDQLEIEEIWMATEDYIRESEPEWVSLNVKKEIMTDILENGYYDYFGVADPMMDLIKAFVQTKEEKYVWADLLEKNGSRRKAAEVYLELKELQKYEALLDQFLDKRVSDYEKLMEFCESCGKHEKAVRVAEAAVERCKREDLTKVFLLLMEDAVRMGNEEKLKKLWASVQRRTYVRHAVIAEKMREWGRL